MFVDNVLYVNICRIHIDIEKKKGARKEAAFYNNGEAHRKNQCSGC